MKIKIQILTLAFISFACTKDEIKSTINDNFYLRNDGADMPVHVEGNFTSKTFIIVIHGGPGGTAHVYNEGLPEFSDRIEKQFVMVYYDQRGSGTSQGHYNVNELTIDKHVEDLHLLITLLKIKYGNDIKLFLMGHSWGGTLGTAYLLKSNINNDINGWIEVDGAHNYIGNEEIIDNFKLMGNEQIKIGNSTSFWEEVINYCDGIDLNNISAENISKLNDYGYKAEVKLSGDGVIQYNFDSTNVIKYFIDLGKYYLFSPYDPITASVNSFFTSSGFGMFDEVTATDYTSQLDLITVPTLIIWGKYDMVIPIKLGEEAFDKIGSTDKAIEIFPTSGHSPMVNDPIGFYKVIYDFVRVRN